MKRVLQYLVGVILVASIYIPLYIGLFRLIFALGPGSLITIPVSILSFPLIYLLPLTDQEAFLILVALNAVLWGFFVTWLIRKLLRFFTKAGSCPSEI